MSDYGYVLIMRWDCHNCGALAETPHSCREQSPDLPKGWRRVDGDVICLTCHGAVLAALNKARGEAVPLADRGNP